MDIKNLNIDEKFTKETIESFNKRHIVPENINNLIELCNYLQITNKEKFLISNCVPSENYIIDEWYLDDLKFPNFIINFEINENVFYEICKYGLLNWVKFAHEKGLPWTEHNYFIVIANNNLDCLEYLHQKDII